MARADLCIRRGIVAAVLPELPKSAKIAERFDARGLFVLPALGDAHDHTWGDPCPASEEDDDEIGTLAVLRRNAQAGVLAVLDLGRNEKEILPLRDRQRGALPLQLAGKATATDMDDNAGVFAADLYAAGAIFVNASPAGLTEDGWARRVDSPQSAREQVRDIAKSRPDVVKLIYDHSGWRQGMARDVMEAIIDEARLAKLKTVVHIALWDDMLHAAEAGATAVTHLDDDGVVPDKVVAALLAKRVVVIPTLGVQMGHADLALKPALRQRPLLQRLAAPKVLAGYADPAKFLPKPAFWLRWQKKSRPLYLQSLAKLHRAGVPLLVGPDGGNYGVIQGWSVHREMQLWQEAGLPRWAILRAATTGIADFLGVRWGVREGEVANLLVVRADPLRDIANTEKIAAVVVHGRVLRLRGR